MKVKKNMNSNNISPFILLSTIMEWEWSSRQLDHGLNPTWGLPAGQKDEGGPISDQLRLRLVEIDSLYH